MMTEHGEQRNKNKLLIMLNKPQWTRIDKNMKQEKTRIDKSRQEREVRISEQK